MENNKTNEDIKSLKVTLIDESGKSLGEISRNEALTLARGQGLDLVMVGGTSDKPICKILDYGKLIYQKNKRQKKALAAQHVSRVKEIKIRPVTSDNDCKIKAEQARGFLNDGDKVKLSVVFRGREKTHLDLVYQKCNEFCKLLESDSLQESLPQLSWNSSGGESSLNVILIKKR